MRGGASVTGRQEPWRFRACPNRRPRGHTFARVASGARTRVSGPIPSNYRDVGTVTALRPLTFRYDPERDPDWLV
jgi:hypothetical protein